MIYTLSGGNSYLLRSKLAILVNAFTAQYGDFGLEKINAEDCSYSKILESVTAIPFLAEKRLVIIDSPTGNKELCDGIQNVLSSTSDQVDVIFIESKFDKRSSVYKVLKKTTDFEEFIELDEQGLARWVVDYVKKMKGNISMTDARYLVHRAGPDQRKLSNEVDKLLTYNAVISKDSIDVLTVLTPSSTIFDLLDAALHGDQGKAVAMYDEQRLQKVEPQAILALLSWQLTIIAIVKTAGEKSPETIAKEAKLNPFVVRKTIALSRSLSVKDIKSIVTRTLELDIRLKSASIDPDEAMKNLLCTLVMQH